MNGALTSLKIKVDGTDILIIDQTQIVIEGGVARFKETTKPTAVSNYGQLYPKSADSLPYFQTDGSIEYPLVPGTITTQPTGFPNKSDSTLSFVAGTRTFTIAPTGSNFSIWQKSIAYVISSGADLVIADPSVFHLLYYAV